MPQHSNPKQDPSLTPFALSATLSWRQLMHASLCVHCHQRRSLEPAATDPQCSTVCLRIGHTYEVCDISTGFLTNLMFTQELGGLLVQPSPAKAHCWKSWSPWTNPVSLPKTPQHHLESVKPVPGEAAPLTIPPVCASVLGEGAHMQQLQQQKPWAGQTGKLLWLSNTPTATSSPTTSQENRLGCSHCCLRPGWVNEAKVSFVLFLELLSASSCHYSDFSLLSKS